jgi:type IV secretory pathway VirB2 component (pilin)
MPNRKKIFRKIKIFMNKSGCLLLASLLPVSSFAATDVLTKDLEAITDWITSGPATAVIMLAIVGAGYLWMFKGTLSKSVALSIIGGAGFIYSAGFIGGMLGA